MCGAPKTRFEVQTKVRPRVADAPLQLFGCRGLQLVTGICLIAEAAICSTYGADI